MKRKICVITGTRAEYGLLYWLIKALHEADEFELQLIVTGMHLSPEYGLTYREIEKDGFPIEKKIEILLSSDSTIGISKSMGLAMISFSEAYVELMPDLIIVLGDRFEIFSAVSAAMISKIPIAHCHGGESTEGLVDESIRHCITKMSHIHFTSTEAYKKRVIQLGERPESVHCVGALGIENINRLPLLNKKDFEKSIGFKLGPKNLIITYHPVTLEKSSAEFQFNNLLKALEDLKEYHFIFTKPNADMDGKIIGQLIDDFVKANDKKAVSFISMGQLRYLSALKHVDGVVGNSSSGLLEAPSFKIGTINIGDRQKGRMKASSIIDCQPDYTSILNALVHLESAEFKKNLKNLVNPYGSGNSSNQIIEILKKTPLENILKKNFYDLI
jgi:GDP/UDP-N,N'-diacetylbacillosamine 2-epimerase (hydrolysing)